MSMKIISASIDLTKIDKSKIKDHTNGSKYYPITIMVNDEKDQYGNDVSVQNSQTKEERESGAAKVYLGNGKIVYSKDADKTAANTTTAPVGPTNFPDDDLPF